MSNRDKGEAMQGYSEAGLHTSEILVRFRCLLISRVSDDDGYIKNIAIINYPDTLPVSYTLRLWASITHP
jgi:hypothetical protein